MFNFSKVGEKIAIIDKSLKYKRKNKIYMNNSKDTADDQFIKQFDNIAIDEGEFMLSPDKDTERTTMDVCRSAGSGKSYFVAQYVQEYHKTFKNNMLYLVLKRMKTPHLIN